MDTHFLNDTGVMLGRSLRHVTRSMDTIITVTIMPIGFMLLFVYVFGGAIRAGTDNYVNYLMPGILLIAIASGITYTAFRLFNDLQSGIFERFHSMPIARSSVLWGHVLTSLESNAISVVVIVGVALLMGFRSSAGVLAWLAVAGILALFTLALTWVAVIPGLSAKSPDGAVAFSYPLIFLAFISSAFVPTDTMPAPCVPSRKTSRSPRSSTRSEPCSSSSRSAAKSGSPSPGAAAPSSSAMRSPWWPTGAK
jgi:ABC-2 type transport system permease protein